MAKNTTKLLKPTKMKMENIKKLILFQLGV